MLRMARFVLASAALLAVHGAAAQSSWREYPSIERGWGRAQDLPEAYREPGEFVVGRLMFPQARSGWALGTGGGDWLEGGTAWTVDYPEGDRRFAELLARSGVPAGVVVDARDIAHNPQLLHRTFFETEHHPIAGDVKLPAGAWKFASNHEPWMRRAAPTLGQHNDEVFRELLGLSDAELDRLRADGIIGEMPKGT